MVHFLKLALPALSLASYAAAQLKVTRPSSEIWWIQNSPNELAWTCKDTDKAQFTVLIANKDTQIQASPQAVVSIQENFQCSVILTELQVAQPVGKGWVVQFANIFNVTDIYTTSEEFEIKPRGSDYPPQATPTQAPAVSGSAASSSGAPAVTPSGSAVRTSTATSAGAIALALAGVFGYML